MAGGPTAMNDVPVDWVRAAADADLQGELTVQELTATPDVSGADLTLNGAPTRCRALRGSATRT